MANLLASSAFNSSGDNNSHNYEIFINHRGPDTKLSIAGHLYSRLTPFGLRVFLDEEEMEKGDFFTSQIAAAIREASVHIAIFSHGYADSEWCLNELLLMLESMESGRSTIIPIFYHVKPADLRWTLGKGGVYAKALTELQKKETINSQTHEKILRYDSDTIEKWRNALSSVSYISGYDLDDVYNGSEWHVVNEVVKIVLEKVKKPPLDVSKYPTGLDQKVKEFQELLQQQSGGMRVMGIVGLGGIGKTTLVTRIFNDIVSNYKQSCFLFDIRKNSLTTLQSDLLRDLSQWNGQIRSTHEGKGMLRRNLSSKQALIVLDNVDDAQQLEALLLPAKGVLDASSLIIVTSRDKQVLINKDIKESAIYKVDCLNQQHSQELFCWHAFDQPRPAPGFERLVKKFSDKCGGLPLSLTVIGEDLRGINDLTEWTAQLRKFSSTLPDDIESILRISYNSLDEEEKKIFLDIACFLIGEKRDTAERIWDDYDQQGWLGIRKLQYKGLVEIDSNNCIRMHDHVRDLGRAIGEKEPPLRLWHLTDSILRDLPENLTVRGINIVETSVDNSAELGNRFLGMRGLQLIRAEGDCLDETIFTSVKSHHLIFLRWDRCPCSCLPPWIPTEHLRVLQVERSTTLEALWEENNLQLCSKALTQSRELNIIDIGLSEIPMSLPDEFCHLESLKQLSLSHCTSLKSLPDSFGNLTKLQHIDLSYCSQLKMLPDSFGKLMKLKYMDLSMCRDLESLPDSFGELTTLQYINLSGCEKLERLPDSIGELQNLQHIDLSCCYELDRLPYSFGQLTHLRYINLSYCHKLERLPDSFGQLNNLRHIYLSYCHKLERLPDSFGELNNLRHINLSHCHKLEMLPDSFGELNNLRHINLSHCHKLERLPDSFGELNNLQHIDLSYCVELERLPDSFCNFKGLQHLYMRGCDKLNISPKTSGKITLSLCPKKIKVWPRQSGTNLKEFASSGFRKRMVGDTTAFPLSPKRLTGIGVF